MDIELLCRDAQTRVASHINRSAGQHTRAMKAAAMPAPPAAPTSADIYAMCCESDTSDQYAKWLCAAAGVAYPPVNQGTAQ